MSRHRLVEAGFAMQGIVALVAIISAHAVVRAARTVEGSGVARDH